MSSQGSSDEQDIVCIWCGISKRLFPDASIRWQFIDPETGTGICEDCWSVLPDHDRQSSRPGDGSSMTEGVE
jgi:hypothetical protein